jgi:hypothetical protein
MNFKLTWKVIGQRPVKAPAYTNPHTGQSGRSTTLSASFERTLDKMHRYFYTRAEAEAFIADAPATEFNKRFPRDPYCVDFELLEL